MTKIHRFQRYAQPENVVTNNVLMLLHRFYDESPRKFQKALSRILIDQDGNEPELEIGPRFDQQISGPLRVADGRIAQPRFDVLIETKLGDVFNEEQAIGHLEHIKDSPNATLLLLGRDPKASDEAVKRTRLAAMAQSNTRVVVASFRGLIDACQQVLSPHDDELQELIEDFESFCEVSGLLPIDEQRMFVPPCGKSCDENVKWRLYYCPAYRSVRAGNWLGIYAGKRVTAVGRISARVVAVKSADGSVLTEGVSFEQRERILGAVRDAELRGWDLLGDDGHRFYVCDEMLDTHFVKDSPGGIAGHRYFDLSLIREGKEIMSVEQVAERLRGKLWSDFDQY